MSALAEIRGMIHLHPNACKSLFEIEQLREGSPEILHEIYRNLRATNLLAESGITQTIVDDIEKKYKKWQETNNSQGNTGGSQEKVEKPAVEITRATQNDFEFSSLSDEMRKRFTEEIEKYKIAEVDSKRHIFILNSIDPGKLDERSKELATHLLTETAIGWFAGYLIFNRVPTDKLNLPLYSILINKINNKSLSKRIVSLSYQLINLSCDYAMYKKLPNNNTNMGPEEMVTLRNCGNWLGHVTLGNNLPILKRDFDIKNRLFLAMENKSITRVLPVIVSIIGSVKESKIFKANNPFIMGILGVLLEIKKETSEKNIAVIDHTFKDLGVNDKQITHFNYIAQKRNVRTTTSQPFNVNPLTEYINIDTRALEKYTANLEIDLKQLVAMAIDLAVKDITKPQILLRSVSIALSTTRELALKDFSFESDEDRLAEATQNMLTSLASNLALVTCTEPLRNTIKEKLEHLLESQTSLPEISIKIIKDIATTDNLPLACSIVKRSVIDKALVELGRDKVIQQALEKRRLARESGTRFTDEKYSRHIQGLPPGLRPNYQRMPHHDFNIYKNFTSNDQANEEDIPHQHQVRRNPTGHTSGNNSIQHENAAQPIRAVPEDRNARNVFDESKLRSLLAQMDVQMDNPNQEERNEAIHQIYGKISKILQSTRDIENYIFPLALSLLEILFKIPENKVDAKLRNYSDILLIYSGYHSKLSKKITEWYFTSCHSETKFNSNTLIIFLRRNLIHIVDFDTGYANLLEKVDINNTAPINCIVFVLKSLVIEDRIFTIFTFKKIVEKLMGFHKKRVSQ
jgi:hypothetical protein